jgi:hypothetical protein
LHYQNEKGFARLKAANPSNIDSPLTIEIHLRVKTRQGSFNGSS